MNTSRRPASLVFALCVLGLLAAAGTAPAQFPRLGFSVPGYTSTWGYGPAVSYNPFLNLPRVPGFFRYQGYTLSGIGVNGPYSISYGYYRNTAVNYSTGGGYYHPEMTTTLGSGYRPGVGRVAAEQRAAVGNAQRNAKWDAELTNTNPDFDRWLKDAAVRREGKDPKAPAVEPALVDPPEEAILSGEVLNNLTARIRELEKDGKKAKPGLYAPELVGKIVFAGGPGAEAANLYRVADLSYPDVLMDTQYATLRADLDKAFWPVAKEAQAGRKTNPADVDRLLTAVGKARALARPVIADAPLVEASAVSEFFARLETATKYLKDEKSTGVAGAKWSSVGATVSEVVQHQAKYGLRFGPAKPGDEAAYYSLHRGLLAYYAGLLQAK